MKSPAGTSTWPADLPEADARSPRVHRRHREGGAFAVTHAAGFGARTRRVGLGVCSHVGPVVAREAGILYRRDMVDDRLDAAAHDAVDGRAYPGRERQQEGHLVVTGRAVAQVARKAQVAEVVRGVVLRR